MSSNSSTDATVRQKLPDSVVSRIIGELRGEKASLASCTLVAHDWLPRSAELLFRVVTPQFNPTKIRAFLDFLGSRSHLGFKHSYVKEVIIGSCGHHRCRTWSCVHDGEKRVDAQTVLRILHGLPVLEVFKLYNASLVPANGGERSYEGVDFDAWIPRPLVQLSLDRLAFPLEPYTGRTDHKPKYTMPREFSRLVSLFSSVDTAHIEINPEADVDTEALDPDDETGPPPPTVTPPDDIGDLSALPSLVNFQAGELTLKAGSLVSRLFLKSGVPHTLTALTCGPHDKATAEVIQKIIDSAHSLTRLDFVLYHIIGADETGQPVPSYNLRKSPQLHSISFEARIGPDHDADMFAEWYLRPWIDTLRTAAGSLGGGGLGSLRTVRFAPYIPELQVEDEAGLPEDDVMDVLVPRVFTTPGYAENRSIWADLDKTLATIPTLRNVHFVLTYQQVDESDDSSTGDSHTTDSSRVAKTDEDGEEPEVVPPEDEAEELSDSGSEHSTTSEEDVYLWEYVWKGLRTKLPLTDEALGSGLSFTTCPHA
ncbi:hypothetical protein BXZ70DRAFT_1011462 [Cristinia sonorae]|uniref:Uncharacterized protein n=1 Tax=Cristinia sonorae TaxID=1940300 RepID=A0A8K0UH85_9AGAR|nr:hypothetical protein BXZ70DRAFT_1011462 [Cristinia sonorae]